jgi:Domain of unknown function (DUF6484)
MSLSRAAKSKAIKGESESIVREECCIIAAGTGSVVTGEIADLDKNGVVSVDYPGNSCQPLRARTVIEDLFIGARVLLAFDGGDPTRPIVLGIVHDKARTHRVLHLKANEVVIEADNSLQLRCGQSTFEAHKDGRVAVKGKDVVSRATRTNKVRGATVLIN